MDKSKVVKMKYTNANQEKTTTDGGYVVQPLLRKGWSTWKGKNKIFEV
jgi:hypothetical protein